MRSRLWLVIVLMLICMMPVPAFATENKIEENEIVTELDARSLGETKAAPTATSKVREVLNIPVKLFGTQRYWYAPTVLLRMILLNSGPSGTYLLVAVAIVFGWWGIRKCIRMIFRAFRKGKMNA